MQGLVLGDLVGKETKEPQPFLMPMARPTGGDEGALGHIEGGKERGRAMAFVIVCHRAAAPRLERQARLGASQRLDLAFLIHAQAHGLSWRVQIEAHDILWLVLEMRILTELKGPNSVGL